ncbi:PLP-dependent aminotransferase family protein [Vibrio sp. Of7-15]|uniref:aminotransferase-like domain-containing protein n=1 Tax=Vibrio sp. Of7-15 TaxID=2724879 RepID=UPI001EF2D8F2|nr:PLP-dependent aminotransferase family protein [Vibrio sp. Of7-15]MCG7496943.1 PLP-dependent aminotransferase family protein [Vibrio sp. Of7-15]
MTILNIALDKQQGPIYKQIADAISHKVEQGQLLANTKLPTHRALADQLSVTVGTITRSYAELERRGVVEARVGAGTYICDKNKTSWVFEESTEQSTECNFGYNIPPNLDRSGAIQQALSALMLQPQAINQYMMYQKPTGIPQHREILADWLNNQGVELKADRLLFSSGAQHGMQMVLDAYTRAGDTLLVEKYTYPGLLSLAKQKQLTVKGVEMDDEGIIPESLIAACRQHQPRFIYLTPTLQNPTTAIMSFERRKQIIQICKDNKLIIIEDDVNGLLSSTRPPPLVNIDSEQVIHIGSLSKCLAPGLRVGYVQAPKHLHTQLINVLQNHSWMISPLLTALACELILQGHVEKTQQGIRAIMEQRHRMADKYLDDFNPIYKQGGFHLWLTLPEQWRLSDFIHAAVQQQVIVKSGELFAPPAGMIPPAVRLALSSPATLEQLEQGLITLRDLLLSDPINEFAL